jgi:predicted nucleic acid-binding protein
MITATDTNILLDILIPNERFYELSADVLERAANADSLMICDLVYTELCTHF